MIWKDEAMSLGNEAVTTCPRWWWARGDGPICCCDDDDGSRMNRIGCLNSGAAPGRDRSLPGCARLLEAGGG